MSQEKVFIPEWLRTYLREVAQANRKQPLTEKEWQQVMMDIDRERALRAMRASRPAAPKMKLF